MNFNDGHDLRWVDRSWLAIVYMIVYWPVDVGPLVERTFMGGHKTMLTNVSSIII